MQNPPIPSLHSVSRKEEDYEFIFEKKITAIDLERKLTFPEKTAKEHFPRPSINQSANFRVCELDVDGTNELKIKRRVEMYFIDTDEEWKDYVKLNSIEKGDSLVFFKLKERPPYAVQSEKPGKSVEFENRQEDTYKLIFRKQITKSDLEEDFIFTEEEAKVYFPPTPLDQPVYFRVCELDVAGINELQIKRNAETYFIVKNAEWNAYAGLTSIQEGDSLLFFKLNKDRPPYAVRLEKTKPEIREEKYDCIFEKLLTATNVGKMLNIPIDKKQHFPPLTDKSTIYVLKVYDFDEKRIWKWDVQWDSNCWVMTGKNWILYIKTHQLDEGDSVQFFKFKQSQSASDSQPPYAITCKKKQGTSAPKAGGDEVVTAGNIDSDSKGESARAPGQAKESDESGKKRKLDKESTNRTQSAESET